MKIQFIGDEAWQDRLYGSGLYFEPQQVRDVDNLTAHKLLKHIDLFAEYAESDNAAAQQAQQTQDDDTAKLQQAAQQEQQKQDDEINQLFDVKNQVEQMDKDSLILFAKQHWNADLSKKKAVGTLRGEVQNMIDQFGLS